ncbi:MAG TPA: condensation domain-containing protein, partial [Burkholderiaceae bacterium]
MPEAFTPAYGLAEATLLVSATIPDQPFTSMTVDAPSLAAGRVRLGQVGAVGARVVVSCGAPVPGLEVRVVNPVTCNACAADEVGELWIAGTSVGRGYHGHGDGRADVFNQRLCDDGAARWLRSGDLGFIQDGEVFVTGRLKDLLIVNGRNIYPQDVEWCAQQTNEGLRAGHGAAFSISEDGGERVVLVQEVARGVATDRLPKIAAAIRSALAREHELAMHHVVLVAAGSVARTSSGKVQRGRCRDDYLRRRLAVLLDDASTDGTRSDADTERTGTAPSLLAALLLAAARIARCDDAAVHADRSAVENGLDSLQCARLVEWVRERTGVSLPVTAVLGGGSLRALAQRIACEPASSAGAVAADAVNDSDVWQPLTPAQQGVWFADRVAGNGLYNLMQATRIHGELDLPRLQHTLSHLMERHDALRLRVIDDDGTPRQQLHSDATLPWQVVDLQALAPEARAHALRQQLHALARHRFDLARAPLVRAVLWCLAPHDHVVALLLHHLVFDGVSAVVLTREWAALYEGREAPAALPATTGYLRFAAWQRRWLDTPDAASALQALRGHLAGTPALELPTDRSRRLHPSFNGAVVALQIDARRTRGLRELAARENATLFMLLMAVFQTQMHRLSGQHDFAVGTPAAARPGAEFDHTVGLFTNTLVMRAAMAGDPPLRELLTRVREEALRAFDSAVVPFDRLAQALQQQRDPRRNLLFQVGLALQSMGDTSLRWPGTRCEALPLHNGSARTDLWWTFTEHDGALHGELEYATDLFDATTARRMASQFERLIDAALAEPEAPLSRLPMLGLEERRFLLEQCNATQRDYPLQWCLHDLIHQQVQRTSHHDAVRFGEQTLTYDELQRRANQLAHHLRELGVGPESIVAVCLQRGLELPVALLAVLTAGGAYLPLDPELPPQRLAFMIHDAGVRIVLTQSSLLDALSPAPDGPALLALDAPQPAWAG